MTAYASIKKIAEPQAGEVAFVSGAAGAVGLVAGQLLKHVYGCKVIGSAGSDEKVCVHVDWAAAAGQRARAAGLASSAAADT
jgi:NADPH-dependent curcumin reductase CurA